MDTNVRMHKKVQKNAKKLLTRRLNRAIMYKLAREQRTLKTIQSKEIKEETQAVNELSELRAREIWSVNRN